MEEEHEKKIIEYSERHNFWANQVLSQFGYSTNLFLTFGIGLLAYLVSQRSNYPKLSFSFDSRFDLQLMIYFISIASVLFSILFGAISVTSRLNDLRITRHLLWARKRCLKKIGKLLPDSFIDFSKESLLKEYLITMWCKPVFIENNFDYFDEIKQKFESLRKQSKMLGTFSWITHTWQIYSISLSLVFIALLSIFN